MTTSEKLKLLEAREQTQEDIIAYIDATVGRYHNALNHDYPQGKQFCEEMLEQTKDDICQIVVNNFKSIEE